MLNIKARILLLRVLFFGIWVWRALSLREIKAAPLSNIGKTFLILPLAVKYTIICGKLI